MFCIIKKRDNIQCSIILYMVLVLIGIAIGILLVVILIIKATRTSSRDVMGIDMHCRKCGIITHGLACPKCEKRTKSFGV